MHRASGSGKLLGQIEVLFTTGTAVGLTDRELLERFLHQGRETGEAAFSALVERHGPMVLRVCNQALRDPHAAEDAFQATFLVLARQARSIRQRDSVESWLFGVAHRAAARIRMMEARRQRYERRGANIRARTDADTSDASEAWPELHAEIARLPEKYRVPLLLCYFEGLTHEQAANRLGWPLGTVKTRLARARERLRWRLERRGWGSAFMLSSDHFRPWAVVTVRQVLVDSTTRAAARFVFGAGGSLSSVVLATTHGVLKAMLINQLRVATITLIGIAAISLGAMVLARQAPGRPQGDGQPEAASAPAPTSPRPPVLETFGSTSYAPDTLTQIHAPFDCRVDKVLADLGSNIRKGDPVLELSSAELAEAKSSYLTARSQWARDKRVLDYKTPLAAGNNLPRTELIEAENDEAQSRLRMKLTKDKLLVYGLTEAEIDDANNREGVQKAKMILRSRGDGVVVQRYVVAGNYYSSMDTLLTLARMDVLWVIASVDQSVAAELDVGQRVTVKFPSVGRPTEAQVEAISWDGAPKDGKVLIRTSIPNPDHRWKAGMFVRLDVELGPTARTSRVADAPSPPRSARTLEERLNKVEHKLQRLLEEKDGRSPNEEILRRLSELERKLNQARNLPREN